MKELVQEPQGVGFFNIKSGDVHYAKLEPTIQAYINSSDMGINASRGQDFGWRLDKEWVKKVKGFRQNTTGMQLLTAQNGGQKPTTVQILRYIYNEQIRAYQEELEDNENPFEEQYQRDIAESKFPRSSEDVPNKAATEVGDVADEADLVPSEEVEDKSTRSRKAQ